MTYSIDIAIDVRKHGNISSHKRVIIKNAEKNHCLEHYGKYEMWGSGRTMTRSHYVMSFTFPETSEINIIRFIKYIKSGNMADVEMVGYDNCIYKLLYASRKYRALMQDGMVKKYVKNKRDLLNGEYRNIVMAARG